MMPHKEFGDIRAGDRTFRITCDMLFLHYLQKIGGNPSVLESIHCAIAAAAVNDGKRIPVSLEQLGTLFTSNEQQAEALMVVHQVGEANNAFPKDEQGKEEAPATTSPSLSHGATSSQRSTSELASVSSGD